MVTFEVDMDQKQLVGWTGTNPKGAPKGGASKAKAKAKAQ
jgi:hypothetical protein